MWYEEESKYVLPFPTHFLQRLGSLALTDFSRCLPSSKAHVVGHMLLLIKVTLEVKFPEDMKVNSQQSIE